MKNTLEATIGNTPLAKIKRLSDKKGGEIYLKLEGNNPAGSVKDRPAKSMINEAEKRGEIQPGDVLIEATSGNTGIALAMVAAIKGYRLKLIMPSHMSSERKASMSAYGAELIEVDAGAFDDAITLRDEMCKVNGWFNCNQFNNPLNVESHKEGTAVEILHQCRNICIEPSAIISGTGTGGTLMGVGPMLKMYYHNMDIVAVEPEESPVMSGGEPGLHGIQGIGDGSKFLVDLNEVDQVVTVPTDCAIQHAMYLAKTQGLFLGISAGANVRGAFEWLRDNDYKNAVTILCDRGERYFSNFI